MPRDASPLELTYESFEQFWKALVSKRKARRLDVDVASAWRQLREGGAGAAFLRLHAESKAAKSERKRAAESGQPDVAVTPSARKKPATGTRRGAKKNAATAAGRAAAGKKAATGTGRAAVGKKAATGTKRGTRRKATRR